MRKLWRATLAAYNWDQALVLAASQRYEPAVGQLEAIRRRIGGLRIEHLIVHGHCLAQLGNYLQARDSFLQAIEKLNRSDRFSEDEKAYLVLYIARHVNDPEIQEMFGLDAERDICLNSVQPRLKRMFPID